MLSRGTSVTLVMGGQRRLTRKACKLSEGVSAANGGSPDLVLNGRLQFGLRLLGGDIAA